MLASIMCAFVCIQVNMSSVVEDSNEKHMVPWADACQKDNIENTPLSPFLDQVRSSLSLSVSFLFRLYVLPSNFFLTRVDVALSCIVWQECVQPMCADLSCYRDASNIDFPTKNNAWSSCGNPFFASTATGMSVDVVICNNERQGKHPVGPTRISSLLWVSPLGCN